SAGVQDRAAGGGSVSHGADSLRIPHAMQRLLAMHRRCGIARGTMLGGPGSAARHCVLRCARDTETVPRSGRNSAGERCPPRRDRAAQLGYAKVEGRECGGGQLILDAAFINGIENLVRVALELVE